MPHKEKAYVLGTDRDELVRLGLQHQLWSGQAAAAWERAGFGPGQRLLDVGCGPGYATFDLALRVGERGRVFAMDLSQRFVRHVRAQAESRGFQTITAKVGSVESLRGIPGGLDGAYARWVLCFVPDPAAVVASVARRLRRGGAFVIQDYVQYEAVQIAPEYEAFRKFFRAVAHSWRQHGGDPNIGAALPGLLQQHGFVVREITPLLRVARPGKPLWHWPDSFFKNYVPVLVKAGLLTPTDARLFFQEWRRRSKDPAAFFVTPPMVEIIAIKK
jgi:ubiquinone/menaquinone biosynthesis C-methylase UbiE